jgi:single-stranded-DNA-specific exonuclease
MEQWIFMKKGWNVLSSAPQELFDKYPDIRPVVLQLLYNRGIVEEKQIQEFLDPEFDNSHDPFLLKNMEAATDLIISHIKENSKIIIYGDYDADGITSASLLFNILKKLRADVDVYIPERITEGYGLNKKAIDGFAEQGAGLVITVDTGIRSRPEVDYARDKGMDVLVTDHHTPEENDLPDCLVIDPHVSWEKYPFKHLAGVGVAFKLASALISKTKLRADEKEILIKSGLDLVAIGTVADCVPVTGENRILVNEGLKILNNSRRQGLIALIQASGLNSKNKRLQSWNIGFQLAPRLNASGRLGSTEDVVNLLVTRNRKEAEEIVDRLNQKNTERQRITEDIVASIEQRIDSGRIDSQGMIVAVNEQEGEWSEGVVGLVAGRICEKYYKPTLVITKAENEFKGSGRSIKEFNLIKAITGCKDVLDKYGGHPAACGFSLSGNNLKAFTKKIKKIAEKQLQGIDLKPQINIDAEVDISNIDNDFVIEVEKMAPFGEGNPLPVFVSRNVLVKDITTMGADGKHIKFRFNGYWALAFGKAQQWKDFKIGDKVDIVYSVEFNNFNGNTQVQLKLWDIASS